MKVQDIESFFREAFSDRVFSSAERKALSKILLEEPLQDHERDLLRGRMFEIAEEGLVDGRDRPVLEWLRAAWRMLLPDENTAADTGDSAVFFSPGDACLEAIRSFIYRASRTLDICVFTISDDRISEEIIAAHRRKIQVRIITDDEKLFDTGSDIDKLARAGLDIRVDRTAYHMHHKFAIADGKVALTGSYNWTRSAAQHNEENLLITCEPGIITAYARQFDKMWDEMKPYV
jgi:phosphatidylserine/phosphatidylglycerophosphate/cardiolipin synthase-like enzyme